MAGLTPNELIQIFPVSSRMNLLLETEKVDKDSLNEWVSDLLRARELRKLCPLPDKEADIWDKLPCGVEIKKTLKQGISIDGLQESELSKRFLQLWGLNFFQDVFSEEGRGAVYNALFHLLSYIDELNTTTPSEISMLGGSDLAGTLQKHWSGQYIGPSCESLRDRIREYEVISKENKHYSKSLLFVQSSGTGKSRLADEYGKFCPMVTYVLRNDDFGFPPPDRTILDIMCDSPNDNTLKNTPAIDSHDEDAQENRALSIRFHAVSIGILHATFETYLRKIQQIIDPEQVNKLSEIATKSYSELLAQDQNGQSRERIEFCENVRTLARQIANNCIKDQCFRHCFNNMEMSKIRDALSKCKAIQGLHTAIDNLEKCLGDYTHNRNDPLFTLVFDEVHGLINRTGQNGLVIALNRVISIISNHKIWFFFLSTESILNQIQPPDNAFREEPSPDQPSYRGVLNPNAQGDSKLERFPPFTDFAVDITDFDKSGGSFFLDPRRECMRDFGENMHKAKFGRPLWLAYDEPSTPPDQIARVKLIGGNSRKSYDAFNSDHVFAVLSVRICLDLNMANPITIPMAHKAVNLHMRRLDSLVSSTGLMFTRAPTEPILAKAAMQILCEELNWANSLNAFTRKLLERNAIDKGTKGELFMRLMFTLAHDALMCESKYNLYDATFPTFTVQEFLKALFAKPHHKALDKINSYVLKAHMNFLGFTSTDRYLREADSESFKHLCYSLLRRSMALQLARQQETFDQLIPFYCGSLGKKPFDVEKVGAILVQIKYRKRDTKPSAIIGESFFSPEDKRERTTRRNQTPNDSTRGTFWNITGNDRNSKRLFLLVDLGSDKNSVDVSFSEHSNHKIWVIHSKGRGEEIFRCPGELHAQVYVEKFFNDMKLPSVRDIAFVHDKDLLDNVVEHDKIYPVSDRASIPSPYKGNAKHEGTRATRKRKAGDDKTPSAPSKR